MKDILNLRIKKREDFRPFAPSILEEKTGEWFEENQPVPFMEKVYKVKEEKRRIVPAVTNIDGTGRLQTVSRISNQKYYDLIKSFEAITGVPILLNTSFNENEPIVNTPAEAIDCFMKTKIDFLVLENLYISRG
jgi:carbamoyltransferase